MSSWNWEFWGWCSKSQAVDCHSTDNLFYESNVTGIRVIAPSLGQTGTTTVIEMLRTLGWKRAYHADDFSLMAKGVMKDMIDPVYFANTASRCRMTAISLEPITDLFEMVLTRSPQAKVVLTWRDHASWLRSTSTGGQKKDIRSSYMNSQMAKGKKVLPYMEAFDEVTGIFQRWRLAGRPVLEKPDILGFMYRAACNGYAWPQNDVYNRGTYKVQGQEEAYLAQIDEIRRLTPPDRLLVMDVKTASWKEFEEFLGLPHTMGNKPLPRGRSKNSRTNDPWFYIHWHIAVPSALIFCALHAVNYLLFGRIPGLIVLWLLGSLGTFILWAFSGSSSEDVGRPSSEAEERYQRALKACPIVAILRGLVPSEALEVGKALVEAGVTIIEVPLNSPNAVESVRILAQGLPESIVVGAGTVLTEEQVEQVAEVGGIIIVSPNMDPQVIRKTRSMGLVSLPGVATMTEAFAALSHGASGLKAFPGEQLGSGVLKAWRAVLPKSADLLAVGGVTADNMAEYLSVGVNGFGVGSALFKPGDSPETIRKRAADFVKACPRRG